MTNAYRDENYIPTLIAVLDTDGVTIKRVLANSSANAIKISIGNSGSNNGTVNAKRDDNDVHCLMAVSSVDGFTPVTLYTDSSGNLLCQSLPPTDDVLLIQDNTFLLIQNGTNLLLNP